MPVYKVGYFVGSLSSTSINRVLSKALIRLAPEDLKFSEIPIGNLPLYNPDFDANYPPEATALKKTIAAADAVLFVTPEYNRSIPGALKERHRLGVAALGQELVPPHPCRRDRGVDRRDWHGGRPAKPARGPQLLQCAPDDLAGGLHPFLPRRVRQQRRGQQRGDRIVPAHLHDRVPGPRRAGANCSSPSVT